MFFPRPFLRSGGVGKPALGVLGAAMLCAVTLRAQDTPAPSATATATPPPTATASPTSPTPDASPRVLYPSKNTANFPNTMQGHGANPTTSPIVTLCVLAVFCAVGYFFLKQNPGLAARFAGLTAGRKLEDRKLNLSESRSLGNRQFLVVVEYESERMLLGVTPGRIDYLCPLRGADGEPGAFPVPKESPR